MPVLSQSSRNVAQLAADGVVAQDHRRSTQLFESLPPAVLGGSEASSMASRGARGRGRQSRAATATPHAAPAAAAAAAASSAGDPRYST